jgi:hypothetical protein
MAFRKLRRRLRELWELRYVADFDLRERLKDLKAFRQGGRLAPTAEFAGALGDQETPRGVAVVAVYPTEPIAFSILNLLSALRLAGFWTLVVSSATIDEGLRHKILKNCNHLLERLPFGRDFGSYQMGLDWLKLKGKLDAAEFLALTNDSLFVPASFSGRLQEFLRPSRPWYALFENFEHHYHTQSFFQIFRKDMFNAPAFEKFWASYTPYSPRKHTIFNGEVDFTRQMVAAGFLAHVMFSSARVCEDVAKALTCQQPDPSVVVALTQSLGDEYFSIIQKNKENDFFQHDRASAERVTAYEIANRLAQAIEKKNPTQSVGLLCNVLYEAPIKRDIVYRNAIDLGVLVSQCRGFTGEEKEAMNDDLRSKGLPISLLHSRRLMVLYDRNRI